MIYEKKSIQNLYTNILYRTVITFIVYYKNVITRKKS